MTDLPPPPSRYKAVLLFGPPGSGKGTQGKILAAIPGFFHSSSGDIFRSLDLQSEAGRMFWQYSSRGELVPDEFTINVWRNYIRGMEMINGFHPETELLILDGIPRSVQQARLLADTIEVARIIHLRADFEKMIERLRRRALKENRIDDAKDEVIRRRMEVYERDTRPLLAHYPAELVTEIDATMGQLRVLREILKVLIPIKDALDAQSEGEEPRADEAASDAAQATRAGMAAMAGAR